MSQAHQKQGNQKRTVVATRDPTTNTTSSSADRQADCNEKHILALHSGGPVKATPHMQWRSQRVVLQQQVATKFPRRSSLGNEDAIYHNQIVKEHVGLATVPPAPVGRGQDPEKGSHPLATKGKCWHPPRMQSPSIYRSPPQSSIPTKTPVTPVNFKDYNHLTGGSKPVIATVETSGLEPPTPGLQSRCSPN